MKRKLICVCLAVLLCMSLAVSVCAVEFLVCDSADLLTDREEAKLTEKLKTISQENGAQIVIETQSSMPDTDLDNYVEHIYDITSLGYGADRSGVLLVICMDIREYRILSNGYAAEAIGPSEIDAIGDAIVSDLSDGNYYAAFSKFADQCDYYLQGYRNGYPFEFGTSLLIALVVGLVAGLIVALVLKSQLRSVHRQNQANVYVKNGSLKLTAHHDIFLYRNVTRRKRESSSSGSRSSGRSRSVGGGRF